MSYSRTYGRWSAIAGVGWLALASGIAAAQTAPGPAPSPEQALPAAADPVQTPADAPQAAATAAPTAAPAQQGGIQEIVVTAQKRAENLQNTPIAITALTSTALQKSGVTDLSGVVKQTPALYFAPYPSSDTTLVLFMRGQGIGDPMIITKDGGVGLYVDGIYQARPQNSTFDLADVERVEVLRGPQGTLYGRNTTGGAVNIITKKPTGEFGVHGVLSGGNLGYRRALVNMDLPEFAGFKVKLTGLYSNQDGWAHNAENTGNTPDAHDFQSDRKYAFRGAIRWEPSSTVTIDYSGDYSNIRTTPVRYVTDSTYAPIAFPGYTPDPEHAYRPVYLPYSHVESDGQTLIAEWRPSSSLTLRSLSGYRHVHVKGYQDYVEAFLVPFDAYDEIGSKTYSQEFQAVGNFGRSLKYVLGLYYYHENASHFETVDEGTGQPNQMVLIDRLTHAKSTSKAAYGQVTWTPPILDDRLDLTFGARYTIDDRTADRTRDVTFFAGQTSPLVNRRFLGPGVYLPYGSTVGATDVHNKKFNPAFTANFQVTRDVMVYGKIVTGYKAGGANEASPTFTRTFGPESVTSYEVGLKSELFDRHVRFNIDGFIGKYRDLQLDISADAADASLADTFNVGRATVKGIETDITIAPTDRLTFQANYTYTTSKLKNVLAPAGSIFDPAVNPASPVKVGDDITGYFVLPFTPRNSVHLSGDWRFLDWGDGSFDAHVDYNWKDKVYTTSGDGPSVPVGRNYPVNSSFGIVDARLTYTIDRGRGRNFSVGLWGKNIFDKRYPGFVIGSGSILTGYPSRAISYGMPATYGIDIGFSF